MKTRFDVAHYEYGVTIEPHFCRSWEPDNGGEVVGCYGTNPDHGYSFEEACDQVAEYHERQAKEWRARTTSECRYYLDSENV
jgi:hypothetical protein